MKRNQQKDIIKKLGPPKLIKKTPKYTTAELLRLAWPEDKERAKRTAVKTIHITQTPKSSAIEPEAVIYTVRVYNKDNKHIHTVNVFYPKGKFGIKQGCRVNCNCPRHVYWFEYALAKKYGNAYLWRSTNASPMQTNPRMVAGLCKHSIMALRALNRRNKAGKLPKKATGRSATIKLK